MTSVSRGCTGYKRPTKPPFRMLISSTVPMVRISLDAPTMTMACALNIADKGFLEPFFVITVANSA